MIRNILSIILQLFQIVRYSFIQYNVKTFICKQKRNKIGLFVIVVVYSYGNAYMFKTMLVIFFLD